MQIQEELILLVLIQLIVLCGQEIIQLYRFSNNDLIEKQETQKNQNFRKVDLDFVLIMMGGCEFND
ncbi:unnamed protein product [Paramecium octaurelia]|uniref:Uncharacterized protein n=1 Tax=Paramecium octaurelia TaxID=43137 RepID=A0A8S1UIT3_PAROT|nr:unnamed protein product [Paramecium octaurelia]